MAEVEGRRLAALYKQSELWEPARFERDPGQRLRARAIASLLDPGLRNVLDVGCGNGFVTERLRAENLVVGLDTSDEALAWFDGTCVVGKSESLPFADEAFDGVICTEVLEHLAEKPFRSTLAELARVAKYYLVISVPYREDLREGMTRCVRCGRRFHVDLHQRSFRGPSDILKAFPDFIQEGLLLLRSCDEIRSRLFRWTRWYMLGPEARSRFARCPHCGSEQTAAQEEGRRDKRLRRRVLDGLGWRMARRTRARWMVVLLRRRGRVD